MLSLAHTWILREFLVLDGKQDSAPDVFVHNLSPDILTIHNSIDPATTHGIARFRTLPAAYQKGAFVQLHLLVDDMAHYGEITDAGPRTAFNPDSRGYCYLKGRELIEPIRDFYRCRGEEISPHSAAYHSHIIVEIAFDRVLSKRDGSQELRDCFREGLRYALDHTMNEFSDIQAWLFDIDRETVREALQLAGDTCRSPRDHYTNAPDHAALYMQKFRLDSRDDATRKAVDALLDRAVELIPDYEPWLFATIAAIKGRGFTSPL